MFDSDDVINSIIHSVSFFAMPSMATTIPIATGETIKFSLGMVDWSWAACSVRILWISSIYRFARTIGKRAQPLQHYMYWVKIVNISISSRFTFAHKNRELRIINKKRARAIDKWRCVCEVSLCLGNRFLLIFHMRKQKSTICSHCCRRRPVAVCFY